MPTHILVEVCLESAADAVAAAAGGAVAARAIAAGAVANGAVASGTVATVVLVSTGTGVVFVPGALDGTGAPDGSAALNVPGAPGVGGAALAVSGGGRRTELAASMRSAAGWVRT